MGVVKYNDSPTQATLHAAEGVAGTLGAGIMAKVLADERQPVTVFRTVIEYVELGANPAKASPD